MHSKASVATNARFSVPSQMQKEKNIFSYLGHGKVDLTYSGSDGLRLVRIRVTFPIFWAFVFSCLKNLGSFYLHDIIDQEMQQF